MFLLPLREFRSISHPLLHHLSHILRALLVLAVCLGLAPAATSARVLAAVAAQAGNFAPAPIVNDEGGPVLLTGTMAYSNVYFSNAVSEPMVVLEDQAGYVDGDSTFVMPVESQTLGRITSDFAASPVSYTLALPIAPQGALRDVDNDGDDDAGVMIWGVAYWPNTFGEPYLEQRDLYGGGWSGTYISTRTSDDADVNVIGGKYVVYAPDDLQGFPADFGDDGLLFTADDPIVGLPQGYTVVDMDTSPFTFDRARHAEIEIIEGEAALQADFSDLSYTAAFDALIEVLRREYAFTELKGLDWDELSATIRPQVEAAEADENADDFRRALRDLAWLIPDGHVSSAWVEDDFQEATGGGLGMAMFEVDDGRNLVNYLMEDGPADAAGIELGAEIIAMNGVEVDTVVDATFAWAGPYGTQHFADLQNLRYALRSPIGNEVEITFINPPAGSDEDSSEDSDEQSGEESDENSNENEEQTVTLVSVDEQESHDFSSFNAGLTGVEPPVHFDIFANDAGETYGYVRITTFWDNALLTVQLWERMVTLLNWYEIRGLIIDVRQNEGGDGFLAEQMAAYFFNEELYTGNTGYYDSARGEIYIDPSVPGQLFPPAEAMRFQGEVVVVVGPNCVSACEFFTYVMGLQERAPIIGHYPTAGMGGSIDEVFLPEDESFVFTAGRSVDMNGEIHIEGKGIAPTIRVPVTEESLFRETDPLIDAAFDYLDEVLGEPAEVISTPQ